MESFTRHGETISVIRQGDLWYIQHQNAKVSELLMCGSHKECIDMLGLLYRYLIDIH